MTKPDPIDAEPVPGRAVPRPNGDDALVWRRWDWLEGAPRPLLVAFAALVLGGMLLWAIERATSQIDFQLLVSALRATSASRGMSRGMLK